MSESKKNIRREVEMFWRTMQNVFHNVFDKAMFFSDVHESYFYMRMGGKCLSVTSYLYHNSFLPEYIGVL